MEMYLAWKKLFSLSRGNEWVSIPSDIKRILKLDSNIGIIGMTLCTRESARGAINLLNRMNNSINNKDK